MAQQYPHLIWCAPMLSHLVTHLTLPFDQHAHAAENLLPFLHPGARVLDVGSGSGYLSAVLYELVRSDSEDSQGPGAESMGKVVGIEHVSELVDWSIHNLRKNGLGNAIDEGQIKVVAGDGRKGAFADMSKRMRMQLTCPFDGDAMRRTA